jgi:hypothetical protein
MLHFIGYIWMAIGLSLALVIFATAYRRPISPRIRGVRVAFVIWWFGFALLQLIRIHTSR